MEQIFNGTGVIEEITSKEGKKGLFYKLKIAGRTYNSFNTTESFNQIEAKEFKLNEPVNFEYNEHQDGEIVYKNLIRLVKMAPKEAAVVSQKAVEVAENGNKTGNQIVRMNALTNAIGFFNLNKEVIAYNFKALPIDSQVISETSILTLAEKFEAWVRR